MALAPYLAAAASSGQIVAYRNIASGGVATCYTTTTPGITNAMNRCAHFNESGATTISLQLMFCGSLLATTETDIPNDVTIYTSIEYPAGTFHQIKWSGATSKLLTPGGLFISDSYFISIPTGAQFWSRTYIEVNPGDVWPIGGAGTIVGALGEGSELNGGVNKTMSGTVSTSNAATLRPLAVIGAWSSAMRNTSLALIGDSNIITAYDTKDSQGNYGYGRAATGRCPVMYFGGNGVQILDLIAAGAMTKRLAIMAAAGITHIFTDLDVAGTESGSGRITDMQDLWAAFRAGVPGVKVGQQTVCIRSTATAGSRKWYEVATQTPLTITAGPSSLLGLTSDFIRTTSSVDFYVDASDLLCPTTDSGTWINGDDNPNPFLQTSDFTVNVTGSPTTTVIPNDSGRPLSYYTLGQVTFTSGALSGTVAIINSSTLGTITVPALASAPAPGDTMILSPRGVQTCNNDGLHFFRSTSGHGSFPILTDNLAAQIDGWNA